MKIIPNVHDYLMEQTFNIRGNLAFEFSVEAILEDKQQEEK